MLLFYFYGVILLMLICYQVVGIFMIFPYLLHEYLISCLIVNLDHACDVIALSLTLIQVMLLPYC